MPTGIVTETCPAPECNLTDQDIHYFMDEMASYIEMFEPAFLRPEQLEWSKFEVIFWPMRRDTFSPAM